MKIVRVTGATVGVIHEMSNSCRTWEVDVLSERFAWASESIVVLGVLGGLKYLPKRDGLRRNFDVFCGH